MDAIANVHPLGSLRPGQTGRIVGLVSGGLAPDLEERLLRMGLAEDARVRIMHEGPVSRDPLAVKVDGVLIALRRLEAASVLVEVDRSG